MLICDIWPMNDVSVLTCLATVWFVPPTHQQTDSDQSKQCSVKKATMCRVFAFGPDQMKRTTDVKVM